VYAATKNPGKLRELRELFAGSGWEIESYAGYGDVAEGETSYAENAALKARTLRATLLADGATGAVLGDDSGLEVAALDGRPGVLSARYGGSDASWAERRARLLAEVAASGSKDRSARFVCALHYITSNGSAVAVEADVRGSIAEVERGESGFSFDPIFWYPAAGKTFAELEPRQKNAISHRGRAVSELLAAVSHRAVTDDGEAGRPVEGNKPRSGV
jgi:XTP/dITP diphosphohydrolase